MQRLVALVAATAVLWNLAGARGSAIEQQPEPGEASTLGEATATLTVITEPVAATVYVAGRPRGETPVEVAGLPAGDHRVTIVKEGYINNSRVVALAPNQAERLNVTLTASAGGGHDSQIVGSCLGATNPNGDATRSRAIGPPNVDWDRLARLRNPRVGGG